MRNTRRKAAERGREDRGGCRKSGIERHEWNIRDRVALTRFNWLEI